jgi:CheY-like chemotaxis protein
LRGKTGHPAALPPGDLFLLNFWGGDLLTTILLIDDDQMVREVTKELLEISGYETLSAADGAEALVILENRAVDIDLVLLDLSLPDMNGIQLLHRISLARPRSKVIICTGSAYAHASELKRHPAVKAVLQKPFNLHTLQEVVRSSQAA